jgi:hypothetical protein
MLPALRGKGDGASSAFLSEHVASTPGCASCTSSPFKPGIDRYIPVRFSPEPYYQPYAYGYVVAPTMVVVPTITSTLLRGPYRLWTEF